MRTISLRSAIGLVLLPWAIFAIMFQVGAFDRYVKYRIQDMAQDGGVEPNNHWLGVEITQYPNDLMIYQDLVQRIKPDLIIETGTNFGGLSLYLSCLLDVIHPSGKVATVDIDGTNWRHTLKTFESPAKDRLLARITFLEGSSVAPEVLKAMGEHAAKAERVLVILDALHTKDHVLAELQGYGGLVSKDSYIIVNDTLLEGRYLGYTHGTLSAAREFLARDDRFVIDLTIDRFYISCAHSGFLKRVK